MTKVRRKDDGTWEVWNEGGTEVEPGWFKVGRVGRTVADAMDCAYQLATSESAARIKALEAENERMMDVINNDEKYAFAKQLYAEWEVGYTDKTAALEARIAELEGALPKYGGHMSVCMLNQLLSSSREKVCDCGWSALAATAPVQDAGDNKM